MMKFKKCFMFVKIEQRPWYRGPFQFITPLRALEMAAKPLGTSANFKPADGER